MTTIKKIILWILIVLFFFMYGACAGIQALTFVNGWLVLSICMILSLISGLLFSNFWRRLTCKRRIWINYLLNLYVVCALLLTLFYVPNISFQATDRTFERIAVIERVYYKTRYKKKRISRRVYGRGEPYKVYYIDIRFDNGTNKSLEIPLSKYNRMRKSDRLVFEVRKGLWGIDVMGTDYKYADKMSK